MVEWGNFFFPWKMDWRRSIVGYWLTNFSTLSLIKLNSAWKRTSTVSSPLLFLWGVQDLLSCSTTKQQVLANLAAGIGIHHITYLLFLFQATLTMSTMSIFIPWITLCQPTTETITIQPLPLGPVLSGENITQMAKRKKSSPVTVVMRPSSKEMRASQDISNSRTKFEIPVWFTSEPKESVHCLSWEASTSLSPSNALLKQTLPLYLMHRRNLSPPLLQDQHHTVTHSSPHPRWSYVLFKDKLWPQLLCWIQILQVGRLIPQNSCALYFPKRKGKSVQMEENTNLKQFLTATTWPWTDCTPLGILFLLFPLSTFPHPLLWGSDCNTYVNY